jgi:hypothetical protein
MINFTRHGQRCRAKRLIRSHAGIIEQSKKGTIAFETENLGRQLILVDWDQGMSTYTFTNEIEIIDANECCTFLSPKDSFCSRDSLMVIAVDAPTWTCPLVCTSKSQLHASLLFGCLPRPLVLDLNLLSFSKSCAIAAPRLGNRIPAAG